MYVNSYLSTYSTAFYLLLYNCLFLPFIPFFYLIMQ